MRVVDLADRPAGCGSLRHGSQCIARDLEHALLGIVTTTDRHRAHQAGRVASITACELDRQLIDGIKVTKARGTSNEQRAVAGAEHWPGGRRVAAAGEDRYRSGGRNISLEGARPRGSQHRFQRLVGELGRAPT